MFGSLEIDYLTKADRLKKRWYGPCLFSIDDWFKYRGRILNFRYDTQPIYEPEYSGLQLSRSTTKTKGFPAFDQSSQQTHNLENQSE